ncbi:class I SAM-dependent methyltransferase [uncultured Porphyromonas sp.]|uniref:THUMP-like domain-containing protein n=1 Tax=uncultured Porphyromonas sp. TaxID=159274 RepID=UPI002635CAAD|nr:class I SAM-dependent methyltransferase [uncultured Porphyromonas sp.]
MLSQQEIEQAVALSRLWADRSPDRILFERSELEPELRRQIALQVSLLPKMQRKVPHFLQGGGYVPHRVNFEQSSSELTACYKQQFVTNHDRVLDMTGGMGIDALSMASVAEGSLIYEIDPIMAQALTYNVHKLLQRDSVTVRCGDALAEIEASTLEGITLVYADPARRDMDNPNKRLISMEEYSPAPLEIVARLQELGYTGRLLLKLSPMLDIQWILERLPHVYELHIVQLQDEVKELLVAISLRPQDVDVEVHLAVVDRFGEVSQWSFPYHALSSVRTTYATKVEQYIHIPQPLLMKSGAYHLIAEEQSLSLLGPNSHIYTSSQASTSPLYKTYKLIEELDYSKSTLRGKSLQSIRQRYPALTIMSRHFPLTAQELKKTLRTDESDTYYLFATTLGERERKLLILTSCQPTA